MTRQQIIDSMLQQELYRSSLYEYTKAVWPLIDGAEYIDNWHIQALCEHLQAIIEGYTPHRDWIFNLGPRTMKTTIICVIWPTWIWIDRPEKKFLVVSNGEGLAKKCAVDSLKIIESDFYQEKWGHKFKLSHNQREKLDYTNTKNGGRASTTIRTTVMGRGGDVLIADDFNDPYESENDRDFVINLWRGTLFNRVNNPKTSCRIILQQRTGVGDLTGHILSENEEKQWQHFFLPMEYDIDRKCKTIVLPSTNGQPWEDPRIEHGELLWPNRFDEKYVKVIKKAIGTHIYAGQYQQNPKDEEGGLILRKWWQVWKEHYRPKLNYIVQSWDTALTEKEMSAYSACTTWGVFETVVGVPNIILLSAWRGRVGGPELLRRAIRLKENYLDTGEVRKEPDSKYSPDIVVIEEKASGYRLVSDLIERGIPAHGYNPGRYDKVNRVHLVSPYIECGFVWAAARPPHFTQLRQEAELVVESCALFPNGDGIDIVDTLTQAILYMKEKGILKHIDELSFLADELEDKHKPGYRPEGHEYAKKLEETKIFAEEEGRRYLLDPYGYMMGEDDA